MAKESVLGLKILNNSLNLLSPKHCFLSCFLLQEKQNINSKWKDYYNIMPTDFSQFPIFFNDTEFDQLKGSPFLSNIN